MKRKLNEIKQDTIFICSLLNSQISFITVIEQLKSDKLTLTAKMNKFKDQTTKTIELKKLTEEKVNQLKLMIQAAETDKQLLQQNV